MKESKAKLLIDEEEMEEERREKKMKTLKIILRIFGVIFLIALILLAGWFLRGCKSINVNSPTPTPTIAVTATPTPTPIAEGKSEQTDANTVRLFILNPTASPQTQIGHPSIYVETHVSGNPIKYVFDIPQEYVGIVGGYNVDGVDKGVYKAFGPGHYEIVVTDGFGLITNDNWAQAEFEFRIQQAIDYKWAHAHIIPGPLVDPTITK